LPNAPEPQKPSIRSATSVVFIPRFDIHAVGTGFSGETRLCGVVRGRRGHGGPSPLMSPLPTRSSTCRDSASGCAPQASLRQAETGSLPLRGEAVNLRSLPSARAFPDHRLRPFSAARSAEIHALDSCPPSCCRHVHKQNFGACCDRSTCCELLQQRSGARHKASVLHQHTPRGCAESAA